ncbi:Repeat domain-containing protein [Palleronia marisminoris]|uniref:ASPIC and UnbV n=1 Tax=Palleronia marisminoris TaxID=315423 RepID=A0A1Y5R7U7_9RHOB|nr:CRTAC1 family protein [Palleronia marisminoris]SFG07416.1 Repeat domain-containing protein [Palleronia marisminoris]SLN11169.1 ASPIC and UnbV [Palleronia marisminoris]
MKPVAFAACLAVFPALAGAGSPTFQLQPDALPVEHIYSGGWEHFVGGGVAVFDCNGDGRPDLAAAGGSEPARLFVNQTLGEEIRFTLGTLPDLLGTTGLYPLDIDGDGPLDLVVLRVGENQLLKGDGACGFGDNSEAWGFDGGNAWSTAFSATWESGRDLPTLAIGNYVDRTDPEGPFGACDDNALYRAEGGRYGPPVPITPGWCALSMLISDWQRRGTPELRISNDRHYYVLGGFEEMWRLDPLAPRTEADEWEKVSLWGMGIASADITGDGLPEVMLTSMGDQLLQFNDGENWRNAPYEVGAAAQRPYQGDDGRPSTGWHAEFADVDNDTRLDLFIAKGNVDQMPSNAMKDPNNLLMQTPEGRFEETGGPAGIADEARSRGAALADFDGDGRLDLVVSARRAPLRVWRNETEGAGNWLGIEPRTDGPNTRAVGAWIELRAEAGTQVREITVGGGHAGGQAGPIHFGLGEAVTAEMRVIWPHGTAGQWQPVEVNRVIRPRP